MSEDFPNGQRGISRLPPVSPLIYSTTEANLPNQTPAKTFVISASAAMPKDLPLWAERNRKIDALRLRYERQPSGLAKLARMFHSDADDEAIAARDLVTDLSISLQSSKTADIRRFAAESADLLSDFRTASAVFAACFTHLQKAQPITLAHHMGAYFEMFKRDRSRMHDIYERMNYCPLGAGALAGTTYPLDREYTAELLGFYGPMLNSMDCVSDRDYLIEYLSAMSTIMMHLSRFCEEVIIWNSNEYQFVEMDDAYSTGSSIMPQKKNPDIAELVRGKTGRVYGALMSLLTTMKGIPLAYNKDMQEDKELVFDAIDTTKGCIALFTGMLDTMSFRKDRMSDSARHGFTNATDAADYLVNHGVPFRDAHGIVGRLVLYCIEKKIALDDMSLEEYRAISPVFDEDIYEAISMETCVNKRLTIGAPGKAAMENVLEVYRTYLAEE